MKLKLCTKQNFFYNLEFKSGRAGPGVSPASPWARATPTPGQPMGKKKKYYT
jgi:hypothetical protein